MFDGVDHIAIVVHDIDEALPYFRDRLLLPVVGEEDLPEAGVRVVYLDLGNTLLQLVEPTVAGPLRTFLEERGEGLHHVCFAVPEIAAVVDRFELERDARVVMGGFGRPACFLRQRPSGLIVELTESEPREATT